MEIWEVGPRDGLQSMNPTLSVSQRVSFIRDLVDAGLTKIEIGSFVSPKAVPAMAHTGQVYTEIANIQGTQFSALVMNAKGLEEALSIGVRSIVIVAVLTDSFAQKNNRCTADDTLIRAIELHKNAKQRGLFTRLSLSPAWHCPYQGLVDTEQVLKSISMLEPLRPDQISLCDTTGKADPDNVFMLFDKARQFIESNKLVGHFHDTYERGLLNVRAAWEAGVRIFDSSVGGIGGCPFAPGAKGNIATEQLVALAHDWGYPSGVNLDKLRQATKRIYSLVDHSQSR